MIASVLKVVFAIFLFIVEGKIVSCLLNIQKSISKNKVVISCLLWALICLITYQPIYNSISPIITYITLCIAFSYIFEISLVKSLISTGIAFLTTAFSDAVGSLILSIFFEVNTFRNTIFYLVVGNVFVILFTFLVSMLPIYQRKLKEFLCKINYDSDKSTIIFILLGIVFISILNLKVSSNQLVIIDFLAILLPLLILFILLILYILERNKYQVLNSQYEVLFSHATSLESWMEKERLSYHEYKNQLAYIRSIVEEKDAIKYIDSILQESFENSSVVDTQIANIPKGGMKGVIFYKLIQAQRKNIQTYISISPKMKNLDVGKNIEKSKTVCRILGIILDNAIDAASVSVEKKISLEMYCLNHKVIFVLMNTFNGEFDLIKNQKSGYTTKGKGHGNGLNYIRNIVAKDSQYEVHTSLIDKYFTQKVIIDE